MLSEAFLNLVLLAGGGAGELCGVVLAILGLIVFGTVLLLLLKQAAEVVLVVGSLETDVFLAFSLNFKLTK